MSHLLLISILAATPAAPNAAAAPDVSAVAHAAQPEIAWEVYRCDFDEQHDRNFDGWPDHWTRRQGRSYPAYVKAAIPYSEEENTQSTTSDPAESTEFLRVDLDGGAVALFSPPIPVSPIFSYVFEGVVRTEKLKHDIVFYSVTFFDAEKNIVERLESKRVRNAPRWLPLRIGPVTPTSNKIHSAVIGLHIEPTSKSDFTGAVFFDTLVLSRLPRMTVAGNQDFNLYTDVKDVEITCSVSGMPNPDPKITLQLIDVAGDVVDEKVTQLELKPVEPHSEQNGRASAGPPADVGKSATDSKAASVGSASYAGELKWRPRIVVRGAYRVVVTLHDQQGVAYEREMTLAVVRPMKAPVSGEFGWSLPRGEEPQGFGPMASLLPQVGISWVKFPVWYNADDNQRADRIARFAERVQAENVIFVGLLDQPSEQSRKLFSQSGEVTIATIFLEPEQWQPIVDPIMTRLSLNIRWWQIGADRDASFVGHARLARSIQEIKDHLERFGQEIKVGFPWLWLYETPAEKNPPWEFLSFTQQQRQPGGETQPSFTGEELSKYLETPDAARPPVRRWIVLQPLPRSRYSLETRARDLVERMMAVKIKKADVAFIPAPFDEEYGLMTPDGSPGELLLPWRTTSHMLSKASYLGSLELPNGSQNMVFSRGDESVMVVWNNSPVREILYLGEHVEQVDLWDRVTQPKQAGNRQVLEVGPAPIFVTGLNTKIVRCRMSFGFDQKQLASVFGRQQTASYHFNNPFDQGVGALVTLNTPDVWRVSQRKAVHKLSPHEETHQEFDILLMPAATSGVQPIRIDVQLTAEQPYAFSIYREIQVGLGDIEMTITTQINEKGQVLVKQFLVNKTDDVVSFSCQLFAPQRKRMRQAVVNLGRGRVLKTYTLPDASSLIGKTIYVRATEIGGSRALSSGAIVHPE